MIHLEEYLDTLEALPMELQRQFTLMRELDALSQDIQEQMKQATEEFIRQPPTRDDPRHTEYMHNFYELFTTVLKHGEEKVALATQTYDLVDKHIRKLDDDLTKFEERQLAMIPSRIPHSWGPQQPSGNDVREDVDTGDKVTDKRRGAGRDESAGGSRKKRSAKESTPPVPKAGTPSGRRTNASGRGGSSQGTTGPSNTSSNGIHGSTATGGNSASGSSGIPSGTTGKHTSENGTSSATKSRGGSSKVSSTHHHQQQQQQQQPDFTEMPIDPNEPRYCYCRQVSYGEMVACDDENCEIEWFHLGCVDLKAPPKGQWFCKDCSHKHKKRRDHHS